MQIRLPVPEKTHTHTPTEKQDKVRCKASLSIQKKKKNPHVQYTGNRSRNRTTLVQGLTRLAFVLSLLHSVFIFSLSGVQQSSRPFDGRRLLLLGNSGSLIDCYSRSLHITPHRIASQPNCTRQASDCTFHFGRGCPALLQPDPARPASKLAQRCGPSRKA